MRYRKPLPMPQPPQKKAETKTKKAVSPDTKKTKKGKRDGEKEN